MLRSIAAVVAGLIVSLALVMALSYLAGVVTGVEPTGPPTGAYFGLNLLGVAIAGVAGGATAVRLAPHTPHGHVWALAFVLLLVSLPAMFSAPSPVQPTWYHVAVSVLGPVSVLVGGLIIARQRGEV